MLRPTIGLRWLTLLGLVSVWSGCDSAQKPNPAPATNLGSPASSSPEASPAATPPTQNAAPMLTVESKVCGQSPDGQELTEFTLTNAHGLRVKLINYGAILTAVEVPDRAGQFANVTSSFPEVANYFENAPYFGGICGRVANRISNAKFTLDGKEYTLEANIAPNHLHGGKVGFMRRVWKAAAVSPPGQAQVALSYTSPDGEEGYPGALTTTVTYSLTNENELIMEYKATTDQPTVLNLTNHAYWNLAGPASQSCLDHEMTIYAEETLEVTEAGIPTGKLLPVTGTCMDFTQPQKIGARITETTNGNGGYDHCYVVRNGGKNVPVPVARVLDPTSGRVMEIASTEPGVQFYTGNYLEGSPKTGNLPKQGAFCLETQHFPDAPNRPEFPTVVLRPGETYTQKTIHKFSVEK